MSAPAGMTALALVAAVLAPAAVTADDGERAAMAHVRLTTEPSRAAGCERVGVAHDDSIRDLRRKIVRAGGNTAVISFRPGELSTVHAEIFRCGSPSPRPPAAIPPPPSGTPPPPPAGPVR